MIFAEYCKDMDNQKNTIKNLVRLRYLTIIGIFLLLGLITWTNYRFTKNSAGGKGFFIHWVSTRALIFSGASPYSASTTQEIQKQAIDRLGFGTEDQIQINNPLYAELLITPFALIGNYSLARAIWITFFELSVIAMAILTIKITRWQVPPWLLPIYFTFSLLTFHGLFGIVDGNLTILVAVFIVASLFAIRDENNILAGLFLALTTIKPLLSFLFLFCALFWAISRRNWGLVRWFFVWLLLLIGIGMIFIPNWPLQNIRAVIGSDSLNSFGSLGSTVQEWLPGIGIQLNWILKISLIILLFGEWCLFRGKDFRHFLWTTGLTLTISQLIGFTTHIGDAILLFYPLILIFSIMDDRWKNWGIWVVFVLILLTLIGIWTIAVNIPIKQSLFSIYSMLNLPIISFIFVGLYWVRWWVIRPTRKLTYNA